MAIAAEAFVVFSTHGGAQFLETIFVLSRS